MVSQKPNSENVKMETENWQIGYFVQTIEETLHLDESLKIKRGYHDALKKFWTEHEFEEREKDPVYKIRGGNYVELLSLGFAGGFNLPLKPKGDLESVFLLCDSEHPIKLIAPDGIEYKHCE